MLVRTGEKYFGAVWIAFALFLCVDMIYCHKYHRKIFPALHDSKIIIGSIILFYASLFLSSLFNGADGSMGFSFSLMKFTVPMWMLLYIIGKYKAMEGSMVGIAAGGLISSGYCIYQYFFIYPTEKNLAEGCLDCSKIPIWKGQYSKSSYLCLFIALSLCIINTLKELVSYLLLSLMGLYILLALVEPY